MADYFSDCFSSTTSASSVEAGYKPGPKQIFSTEFIRGEFVLDTTVAGTVVSTEMTRMFTLNASDRLHSLNISADVAIVAGGLLLDVGVFAVGDNHDGAEVDDNLFGSDINLDAIGPERLDAMFEATTVQAGETGDQVWEIIGLSANDNADYDIVITWATVTTITAGGTVVLEAEVTRHG